MRIKAPADQLLDYISQASMISPTKTPKPILSNVMLVATAEPMKPGQLTVLATNLLVSLRARIPSVDVEEVGSVLINGSRATQILRELGDQVVTIMTNQDGTAVIKGKGCKFSCYSEEPEEFPDVPSFVAHESIKIPSGIFQKLLRRVTFATSTEKSRYAMNGILLEVEKEKVRMVATDGKRLAMCEAPVPGGPENTLQFVVPTKALDVIARLLLAGEDDVELALEDDRLFIRSETAQVMGRLVEGHFPPWDKVTPVYDEMTHHLDLDREEFMAELRKASLLVNRESMGVSFAFSDGKCQLATRVVDIGEADIKFDVPYKGADVTIGFNPLYLMEGLKAMESERLIFSFSTPKKAARLDEKDGLIYVVMPINLASDDGSEEKKEEKAATAAK